MTHHRFKSIVDKVQVTLYIDEKDVKEKLNEARHAYRERDTRLGSLTDEAVDIFYSCLLCQSFAPSHVCVITPERLGCAGPITGSTARQHSRSILQGETSLSQKGSVSMQNMVVTAGLTSTSRRRPAALSTH